MISITLPYLPPREFSRNSRLHWAELHRVQLQVSMDIHMLLLEAGWKPGTPWNRAVVTIQFVLPDRRTRDADNLITAAKPILDSLKHKVFADDSIKCIGIPTYTYKYSRKKLAATVIKIEEAGE